MFIEQWFESLFAKLTYIEQEWSHADIHKKEQLTKQLLALREASDQMVDLWLEYEEKLSAVMKEVKAEKSETETEAKSAPALDEQRILFRKGEGFYHLHLFQEAKVYLEKLVQEAPDLESGRLYYAYSLLYCEEKEAALKEFRLLSKTACSPKVVAISYNGIGCMLADEGQWLEAMQAFKEALEITEHHPDALFNVALCYLHEGDTQDALQTISDYLKKHPKDDEAQLIWLRAAKLHATLQATEMPEAPAEMRMPSRDLHADFLREMATLYEESGQRYRAQICYRYLIEKSPTDAHLWHNLAWNIWLVSGASHAMPVLKKALTLAPEQLEFLFSFGWMHLLEGERDQACSVFQTILQKERTHRLAQSGMITLYEQQGDYQAAKRIAQEFLQASESFVRTLGLYHLGRIAVGEGNNQLAEQYFQKVDGESALVQDVAKYRAGILFSDAELTENEQNVHEVF